MKKARQEPISKKLLSASKSVFSATTYWIGKILLFTFVIAIILSMVVLPLLVILN